MQNQSINKYQKNYGKLSSTTSPSLGPEKSIILMQTPDLRGNSMAPQPFGWRAETGERRQCH